MAFLVDTEYQGLNWRAYAKIDEIHAVFYNNVDFGTTQDVVGELDETKVVIEIVMSYYANEQASKEKDPIYTKRFNVAIPRESENILGDIYLTLKAYSPEFSGAMNA